MTHSSFMNQGQTLRRLKLLLAHAAAVSVVACGGGGGGNDGGNPPPPPPPAAVVADAQFTEELIVGLGFRITDVTDGKTDATGKFKVAQNARVDFFVGQGSNVAIVGTANPTVASASSFIQFSLHDLNEVKAANGEQFLGNLVRLFAALDANSDFSDGIQIDDAANAAVAGAVTGGKTLNLNQSANDFAADPVVAAVLTALNRQLLSADDALAQFSLFFRQSRSSSIALTSDDKRAVVVNRQKGSVSIIRVRNDDGTDSSQKIGEVPVGKEPQFVALSLDDKRAFVTNSFDGTMSVVDLTAATPQVVGNAVNVGFEPRGIAITPNAKFAFIANFTTGNVTIVDLTTLQVVGKVAVGGNPYSVAISNDGDDDDSDERVFVTKFYGELIDPARPDGFDDAKRGVVVAFNVGNAVQGTAQPAELFLNPFDSGFTADLRPFCLSTRLQVQATAALPFFPAGLNGATPNLTTANLKNEAFCPDTNSDDASDTGPIANDPQDVYPNQLFSALIRGASVYVVNVGAQPAPPVKFDVNVQGLVGVLDRVNNVESSRTVNLNTQVRQEPAPVAGSLDKLFMNDIVAVDADRTGRNFLVVSRGGNYVVRAKVGTDGKLTILDDANKAVRFQTGNLPSGIVMSGDGKRAYANNELNTSISALDLEQNTVLTRDIDSSTPPAPGTPEHKNLIGKLAFFTALGVPDKLDKNGTELFDIPLRDVIPLDNKGKASRGAWSTCASCHADGHSDNVTWIFATGPRQAIQLEGTFKLGDLSDQRILNWSGVRGAVTDFNNNSRGVQGGVGFATDVAGVDRSAEIFNHGPTEGISDSLDAMTAWVATVRAPRVPEAPAATGAAGRALFATNCASCHGGAKWTKSRTSPVYLNNPTFAEDPIGVNFFRDVPVSPIDTRVNNGGRGPRIISLNIPGLAEPFNFFDQVGTFDVNSVLEIRGAAAVAGQSTQGFGAFGAAGFNAPSLLGLSISAPYLHDGTAETLEDVFARHELAPGVTITQSLSAADQLALLDFVRSIDDDTETLDSATDDLLNNPPVVSLPE